MMLYYLIYISKTAQDMLEPDLAELLEECRAHNEPNQLTGMLLYLQGQPGSNQPHGRFIQVLEGDKHQVLSIFDKIKKDKRHHHVMVINEGAITKRSFKTWSMGFETMDMETFKNRQGYFDLNNEFLQSRGSQHFNLPLNFLKSFYMMRLKNTG
ncbi:BLUF domain-containing protein [Mucilaginibacter lacusdianchii]|uniref:BLUF domain-containing protein n=1 Tax=Mucilaginibacter lacusdianchii TaxID=2684211 RepID=UPI00131CB4E4|nr:BLUF domain-containing protein [Mucilaginibacter sp. JXJ CY 39]